MKMEIKRWYNENDQLHREDGTAVIWSDRTKLWYNKDRQLHRTDGPAVIWPNGKIEWWLNDKRYSFAKWADALNLDQKARLEMVMVWDIS